jgi:hypothetical protein
LTKAYSKKGITVKCKPVVTAHNKMFMGAFVDAAVSKYSSWDEQKMKEALDKDYKALNALCKFKKGDKDSVEISTYYILILLNLNSKLNNYGIVSVFTQTNKQTDIN